VNGDSIYNGAHDNALGVGILLEMAHALNAAGVKPRRSLLFVAVTAEEKGLLGSDYFARHPYAGREAMVADINIDMPMLFAPTYDFVALGAEHSGLGAIARSAAAAEGYRLSENAAPEQVGFIRSDQFSFIKQGIPAILLHGGYASRDPARNATQLQQQFRQNQYHQPGDDATLPMDYPTAAGLARIHLRMALEIANGNGRPQWRRQDFFGKTFGPISKQSRQDEGG
jgi:Zn-dependent M28 family amino/carboxypeptidase